ncbi:MAG: 2-isopropylmalate synthase [Acutalibacteraceae bacterium]|nr:2-isopropylmalate synthase [Acutalibacteraceae bacterium]
MSRIKIFDTTLRDGEQSPGCSMNLAEKLQVASQLERLGVDIIEAGFAISSPGDFESVKSIAELVKNCSVASLSRALEKDIDCAWEAVKNAADPRIHTFIATSPVHMEYKLKMTPEQVIERTAAMVKHAAKYTSNIEFSCEDAMRSDPDFLVRVCDAAIKSGAKVLNIPDTVGYTTPNEMRAMIEYLIKNVPDSDKVEFSVHCHNDLGMAVANALGGVLGGALQIECTVNGLGERAGNTSLEEVVMAMNTRPDLYGELPRIDTKQIYRTSKLVYNIIGQSAPNNKPIVGANAFAHESGIHQHGVLANKSTYEIMTPESVGIQTNQMVLGKHSGKHAFSERLKELGYELTDDQIVDAFTRFKELCDKKKTVTDGDIEALVTNTEVVDGKYKLVSFDVKTMGKVGVCSSICLKHEDEFVEQKSLGDGAIDALYAAIDKIVQPPEHMLDKFNISAVSEGQDTLGEVTLKLQSGGKTYSGRGLSTDIIEAGIMAYLNAINKLMQ